MAEGVDLNYLDAGYIVLILGFAGKGYRKGLFVELVGFVGIVIALALSLRALGTVSAFVGDVLDLTAGKSTVIAFFAIYLGVLFLMRYVAILVRRHANLRLTDALDRALGGGLGLIKGGVLASLVALFLTLMPPTEFLRQQVASSILQRPVSLVAPFVYDQVRRFLPGDARFVDYLGQVAPRFKQGNVEDDFLNLLLNLGPARPEKPPPEEK